MYFKENGPRGNGTRGNEIRGFGPWGKGPLENDNTGKHTISLTTIHRNIKYLHIPCNIVCCSWFGNILEFISLSMALASFFWAAAIRLLLQLSHCPIQIQSTHCNFYNVNIILVALLCRYCS
jgi:hypothetical protein